MAPTEVTGLAMPSPLSRNSFLSLLKVAFRQNLRRSLGNAASQLVRGLVGGMDGSIYASKFPDYFLERLLLRKIQDSANVPFGGEALRGLAFGDVIAATHVCRCN